MRTQEQPRTAAAWPHLEAMAPRTLPDQTQPCPDKIWWFGVLVGGPLMLIGLSLTLTLFGAPLGIPLWAAGLGLMLSRRPCQGEATSPLT
jgi:hypothetical protein